jgi:uncharacterized damage-inducible protein DinB
VNKYCESAFKQLEIAISSIVKIIEKLEDKDLQKRPTNHKHSIGELLEHIATICKADHLISTGATQEEMSHFYSTISLQSLTEIKEALLKNYLYLKSKYMEYTENELHQKITSYWGVTYSRYEWLLEIIVHIYHHRGQLHAILVHCYDKDPKIRLFE